MTEETKIPTLDDVADDLRRARQQLDMIRKLEQRGGAARYLALANTEIEAAENWLARAQGRPFG